ncbi:hypothetical protein NP493_1333g00006 [Ridgeia piscesae]|uniref:Uncharacterized protein n=1 Tax=Ridgeia piscesae TaxID=27915 RepID=A0AAD9K7K7_RIDPI|nr:hypothetical protein NP493_1333g00006 [Ridgeia piscesae]
MDIDSQWQQIKEMWTSTGSEVLGKKKYQQKDWISADTVNKVQVRKEKKERLNPPPPQNPPDITPAEEVLQINCERPSKAEIEKAIPHMKRGKASGPAKFLPRQSRLT